MKICILGAGNMGGALALGLVGPGHFKASDLTVTAGHEESLKRFKEKCINTTLDNRAAVKGQDVICIAVKPSTVNSLCEEISGSLKKGQIIVCIAAGIKPEDINSRLKAADGTLPELVYVIPNTAVEIGRSVSFISAVNCSETSVKTVEQIFATVGESRVVPLELLGTGMALASCGIAYAMKYIRAAADAGKSMGFSEKDALDIVAGTVAGAASLLQAKNSSPEEEIRKVATPGGHTEKGMIRMEEAGFSKAVAAILE